MFAQYTTLFNQGLTHAHTLDDAARPLSMPPSIASSRAMNSFLSLDQRDSHARTTSTRTARTSTHSTRSRSIPSAKPIPSSIPPTPPPTISALPSSASTVSFPTILHPFSIRSGSITSGHRRAQRSNALAALEGRSRHKHARSAHNFISLSDDDEDSIISRRRVTRSLVSSSPLASPKKGRRTRSSTIESIWLPPLTTSFAHNFIQLDGDRDWHAAISLVFAS